MICNRRGQVANIEGPLNDVTTTLGRPAEQAVLNDAAADCPNVPLSVEPAE